MTDYRRLEPGQLTCLCLAVVALAAPSVAQENRARLWSCPFEVRAVAVATLRERLTHLQDWRDKHRCTADALTSGSAAVQAIGLDAIADAYGLHVSGLEVNGRGDRLIEQLVGRAGRILTSGDYREKAQAAYLLGNLRHSAGLPALLGALADQDVGLRRVAVQALGQIGDPRAVRPLAALVRDTYVYWDALGALEAIGGREAADALAELAQDKALDVYQRENIASVLRAMGDPRAPAIAREVASAARPPWGYLLVFPPLILWLNWRAAKADVAQGERRRVLVYVVCASCMMFVAPLWFGPGGRDTRPLFGALALGLPLGTALLGALLGAFLRLRKAEVGDAFLRRVPAFPFAMWAGLGFWMVAFVIALIIGLGRVHA